MKKNWSPGIRNRGMIIVKYLVIMKLSVFLILITSFQAIAFNSSSQERINLKLTDETIHSVLKKIENEYSYRFVYSDSVALSNRKVDLYARNATIDYVLQKLLHNTYFSFRRMSSGLTVIYGTEEINSLIPVTGRITDAVSGASLAGVSVIEKGTKNGTTTDENGYYTINVTNGNAVLVISNVGFQTLEVAISGRGSVDVVLTPIENKMDEVIVVGYGTQKRRDITGAISNVDLDVIKDVPASNTSRLLVGQIPGVSVKQRTGRPGQQFEVIVRGVGSLGAGSAPLYVIDGMPIGNSLDYSINPSDIESISILKDAVSSAIYGARGANGVVLITTKKGKAGRSSMEVSANYGIQDVAEKSKTKVLNGPEFAQFKKESFMDKIRYFQKREPDINEVPLDFRYPEQTKYSTNWFDEILHKNAPFQNYNLTYAKGGQDFQSLLSIGYIDQKGVLINTDFKQVSAHANVEGRFNDYVKVGLNLNGFHANSNLGPGTEFRDGLVGSTWIMDPRDRVYNDDGSYDTFIGGHDGVFGYPNPVQFLKTYYNKERVTEMITNGFVELKFLKHFTFKSAANTRLRYSDRKSFRPSTLAGTWAPPPRDASLYQESYNTVNWALDQLLTYNNNFGSHQVNVLLGYTSQEETVRGLSGNGSKFPNDLIPFFNSAANKTPSNTEYGWSLAALFTRINYSFADRYLLSATFRREGSSRFGEQNQYGNFPALSAGWRISEEKFMKTITWLNDLKLRASWGVTGNNNIGNYTKLAFMNNNNYIIGNAFAPGYTVSSLPNSILGWETAKQINAGLDLSALQNKLTFTADYYRRITSDMLLPVQVPAISGFTSYMSNIGKVENKGLELGSTFRTRIQNDFGVFANLNFSINRNKVLELRGETDMIRRGDFYGVYSVSKPGRPIGMLWGFKNLGIFKNQAEIDASPKQDGAIPGVYKYADTNGDGVITYDMQDMVEIGNPWPKFTYGFTLGGDFKNFDISMLFNGAYGFDINREILKSILNMDGVFNVAVEAKDRYRDEQNPGGGIVPTTNTWKWERESNSRYVYRGDYLWFKNLSVGYNFSRPNLPFRSARISASIDNFILFTKYPGPNPEASVTNDTLFPGQDDGTYPLARTFSVGIKINL